MVRSDEFAHDPVHINTCIHVDTALQSAFVHTDLDSARRFSTSLATAETMDFTAGLIPFHNCVITTLTAPFATFVSDFASRTFKLLATAETMIITAAIPNYLTKNRCHQHNFLSTQQSGPIFHFTDLRTWFCAALAASP